MQYNTALILAAGRFALTTIIAAAAAAATDASAKRNGTERDWTGWERDGKGLDGGQQTLVSAHYVYSSVEVVS